MKIVCPSVRRTYNLLSVDILNIIAYLFLQWSVASPERLHGDLLFGNHAVFRKGVKKYRLHVHLCVLHFRLDHLSVKKFEVYDKKDLT